jgi:hypothetical protein
LQRRSESGKRTEDSLAICLVPTHEDIEIPGVARLRIDVYGVTAHDDKPNPMGKERGQEIELIRKKIHQPASRAPSAE